jgi:hypothetical protein
MKRLSAWVYIHVEPYVRGHSLVHSPGSWESVGQWPVGVSELGLASWGQLGLVSCSVGSVNV